MSAAGTDRYAVWHRWALAAIILAGLLLRLRDLTTFSLWWDEFATLGQIDGSFAEMFAATANDTYPPGYNVLAWLSLQLFGISEWSLRLPSLLVGTACIPAAYWLGKLAGGRVTGIIAALLTALSPFAIIYSHDARMYSLLMLAGTLAAASAIRLVTSPDWRWAAVAALSNIALLYAHPYGFLTWLCLGAALLALLILSAETHRAFWLIAGVQVLSALAFLPWALILTGVADRLGTGGFWIPRPSIWDALFALKSILGGYLLGLPLLVLLLLAVIRRAHLPGDHHRRVATILIAVAFGPLLLGFLISQVTTPVFISRYLSGSAPALIVLAAWAAASLATTTRRLAAVLITLIALGAGAIATEPRSFNEDWRGLSQHLTAEMRSDDCLIINLGGVARGLRFYMPELPECFMRVSSFEDLATLGPEIARAYVIRSHSTEKFELLNDIFGATKPIREIKRFGTIELAVFDRL